ncbi:sensor histidine kinase [Methanobacterium alcaliphilum]|uniref:sensor histidine kinase n=1 Tax=Methanobacterium alcaliphilum TaxID=392018 RepID=UPI00200ACFF4|nr:ATP-binding protein [Methanobacterium alcaliphilum]MCK9150630.1 ATP-binding protein [Methanobacterium alcaliphilum]
MGRKKLLILFPVAVAIALLVLQPLSNSLGFNISEDSFRLILLMLIVVMVALLSERIERVRSLRKLNEELKKQTEKLEDANDELEAFAYSVSHDLRVPLRAIDGFSRIMVEDYEDTLDEEGIRLLNIIRDNTRKMGQLIDDILLLSRAGRQEMNINQLDMNSLVENIYGEFSTQTEGRNINFMVEDLPPVFGDRSLMYQVFSNLIGNALKFTSHKDPAEITVGCIEEKNEYVFYVQDNGAGFDMKYINKLFGLFQRLHSPEEFEGTGVGLSIVQRIIKRHNGKVWGEGAVDEGAIIYFSMPKNGK